MKALKCLLFVSVVLAAGLAQAQPACTPQASTTPIPWNEARLAWTLPTANTDGSPISGNPSVTVYRRSGTTGAFTVQCVTAAGATGASMLSQPLGQQFYAVTARIGTGPESVQTAPVSKTIVLIPNPPSGLSVLTDLTAWMITQSQDRMALLPVGTVAPGTPCDQSQAVTGLVNGQPVTRYVVPRSAVTFAGRASPQVVLAACG